MIAGFIAIIVLIEASVSDFVLTPVFTRAQSSLHNTRREQGVITPLAPLRRDRDDRGRGSIRLIFNNNNNNNNNNSDNSLSNLKIIYDRVTHN